MTKLPLLCESLDYKDLVGLLKPTVHIDEFVSKMGDDDDIVVLSFFVRSKQAAKDLVGWFEKGYDFVMDADVSPGEIRPGRYLVYVELRRRSSTGDWTQDLLSDLETLTEFKLDDWIMKYEGKEYPWNKETFDRLVPRSPRDYRQEKEGRLNEIRSAAGLAPKKIFETARDLRQLQAAAGI